ncbi:MAG TPA: preprotein translocase subunit SecG [Bacteroidetes bacterium]|nr:preprotein translocase subunit SecG [Bacteroidota bacterium]
MYAVVSVLIVIAAILLILVVLIQNPKGGGIASNFSAGNNIMGVKRTTDFIEKLTWGLAIVIIVLTLSSNAFVGTTSSDDVPESNMEQQIQDVPAQPVAPAQQDPAGGQPNP